MENTRESLNDFLNRKKEEPGLEILARVYSHLCKKDSEFIGYLEPLVNTGRKISPSIVEAYNTNVDSIELIENLANKTDAFYNMAESLDKARITQVKPESLKIA
jgi:hypothetical protein